MSEYESSTKEMLLSHFWPQNLVFRAQKSRKLQKRPPAAPPEGRLRRAGHHQKASVLVFYSDQGRVTFRGAILSRKSYSIK